MISDWKAKRLRVWAGGEGKGTEYTYEEKSLKGPKLEGEKTSLVDAKERFAPSLSLLVSNPSVYCHQLLGRIVKMLGLIDTFHSLESQEISLRDLIIWYEGPLSFFVGLFICTLPLWMLVVFVFCGVGVLIRVRFNGLYTQGIQPLVTTFGRFNTLYK